MLVSFLCLVLICSTWKVQALEAVFPSFDKVLSRYYLTMPFNVVSVFFFIYGSIIN